MRERSIDPEIERALSGNRREEERDHRAGPRSVALTLCMDKRLCTKGKRLDWQTTCKILFQTCKRTLRPWRPMGKGGPRFDIVSLLLFAMIWSLSSALSIIKEWRNTLQRVSRAEADKVKAELAFLKAQINPHFLFNTLNNIYSLAVTKNENTSFAIMKLSNIMRYVTDDATRDFVALQSEVDCISDYIDLQRLRLNKKTEINFSIGGNLGDKQIAPLILITFVENVFKYGISNHEPSAVIIKIVAGERQIELFCQNKIFSGLRRIERTGIGIKNTEQRLKFLYPGKHSLNITIENSHYNVLLTIQV